MEEAGALASLAMDGEEEEEEEEESVGGLKAFLTFCRASLSSDEAGGVES